MVTFEPSSAGDGAGSGSVPFLISWNLTKRCNLKCSHCYLEADELAGSSEVSTEGSFAFIREFASVNKEAMLILTGGEPLLRPDWRLISRCASDAGFTVVMGTNGTLLDDMTVGEMIGSGIKGVGVSLDSASPAYHDRFRGMSGAWEKTLAGIDALGRGGLDFQLQFSVTKENRGELPEIVELASKKGARAVNVFFLVCTGRGQRITDLNPDEYESALEYLVRAEKDYEGTVMVRARCAPHFLRVADRLNGGSRTLKGATCGCIAGRGYLRVSPEGYVTPCPYMPAAKSAPNLKDAGVGEILKTNGLFRSLREPQYNGRCGRCEYNEVCGGCRARSLASSGDVMGEDPWCGYEPAGGSGKDGADKSGGHGLEWTAPAKERLEGVPSFLRSMVVKGVERYARAKGLKEITPQVMMELRKRAGR